MLITLLGLVITAIFLAVVFLFIGSNKGTLVLLLALIFLFVMFFIMLVGLVKGDIKFLKLNGRFNISLATSYLMLTSLLLSVMWLINYSIHARYGDLSARNKMNVIQGKVVVSESLEKMTAGYSILNHEHITFRYHPATEKQVYEIIDTIENITELEKSIFGREIAKTDKLEVITLPNSKDYIQLNPLSTEEIGGSYDSSNKRAMVYQKRESYDDDESFIIGTFTHEYSHYLIDLFLVEEGIDDKDIPAWYKEGISEHFHHQTVDTISIHKNINTSLKYTDLHTLEKWNSESKKSDTYYLAERAIEYIVGHQSDLKILSKILLHQKETGSFEESFDQITGLNLSTLNETIFSLEKELQKAWDARQGPEFEAAERLYKEITEKHPHESIAWHQFALFLEEQKRWDEALDARRKVISINSEDAAGYLNISYLLTIIDPKEALAMAKKSLELTKKVPHGNVEFTQEWVDEISQYHELLSEGKYLEANQEINQSEQLSYNTAIMEELRKQEIGESP